MSIQGGGGKPSARSGLDAAEVHRLVHWSLQWVWPRVRRPGPEGAQWKEEVTAEAYCAACQAMREFDPRRGVGRPVFVSRRILSAVWTMHRRDRSHRQRCCGGENGEQCLCDVAAPPAPDGYPIMASHLSAALERLPGPSTRLLVQVFWEGRRAIDIAAEEGVTKRAVNLRIEATMRALEAELRALARRQADRN
jgi:DNA-directed RNA polymerase specialized sigma24 family protein